MGLRRRLRRGLILPTPQCFGGPPAAPPGGRSSRTAKTIAGKQTGFGVSNSEDAIFRPCPGSMPSPAEIAYLVFPHEARTFWSRKRGAMQRFRHCHGLATSRLNKSYLIRGCYQFLEQKWLLANKIVPNPRFVGRAKFWCVRPRVPLRSCIGAPPQAPPSGGSCRRG